MGSDCLIALKSLGCGAFVKPSGFVYSSFNTTDKFKYTNISQPYWLNFKLDGFIFLLLVLINLVSNWVFISSSVALSSLILRGFQSLFLRLLFSCHKVLLISLTVIDYFHKFLFILSGLVYLLVQSTVCFQLFQLAVLD